MEKLFMSDNYFFYIFKEPEYYMPQQFLRDTIPLLPYRALYS